MCGIAGIVTTKIDIPQKINRADMLSSLSKRGPDGEGQVDYKSAWLGHRRLSIIDIGGGKQPMVDRELTISFNGEIYNYRDLRKDLEKRGHVFQSNSDTEVILKCYREYGDNCPIYLDGMFAFAIWDNENKKLFLARDRFGKKPLYYYFKDSILIFGSEIKTILASGIVSKDLNYDALDNYLRLMYIPPWKSIYNDIHQIPPAHQAIFANEKITISRYWNIVFNPITIDYEEAKQETKRLFHNAVRKRVVTSDVEVGSFLSGGVDSTLVSIFASKEISNPLKTFSLGYGNYINELPYAKQAADYIKSNHHTLQAGEENMHELEKIITYFDEPHADNSDFPQHLLSKLTASNVKVALSGDGGDEIFMGYGWHTRSQYLSYRAHTFEKLFMNPFQGRIRATRVFPPILRMALWQNPLRINNDIFAHDAYNTAHTSLDKIVAFDLTTYLPGQLLSKVDRASMMHGLEVRCPFLDTDLVNFVINLPISFKIQSPNQKHILKDILSEYMPREFVYRKKQGFGAPTAKWLENAQGENYVREKLGRNAYIRTLLSGKAIDFILNRFYNQKKSSESLRLWILLSLEIWLRIHKPKL